MPTIDCEVGRRCHHHNQHHFDSEAHRGYRNYLLLRLVYFFDVYDDNFRVDLHDVNLYDGCNYHHLWKSELFPDGGHAEGHMMTSNAILEYERGPTLL